MSCILRPRRVDEAKRRKKGAVNDECTKSDRKARKSGDCGDVVISMDLLRSQEMTEVLDAEAPLEYQQQKKIGEAGEVVGRMDGHRKMREIAEVRETMFLNCLDMILVEHYVTTICNYHLTRSEDFCFDHQQQTEKAKEA